MKDNLSRTEKAKIRVCENYLVTINPQLETHRQTIPLPADLLKTYEVDTVLYTKVGLADAYNQIRLAPESQKRLELILTEEYCYRCNCLPLLTC